MPHLAPHPQPDHTDFHETLHAAFPSHDIFLNIALRTGGSWDALRFCSDVFAKIPAELLRMTYVSSGVLSFRIKCRTHLDVGALKTAFRAEDGPEILRWDTEIGRYVPPPASQSLTAAE